MEKIKKITVTFNIKKWQVGMIVGWFCIGGAYILAATCPVQHGLVAIFHVLGMVASGIAGTIIMAVSFVEMWEHWDA